MEPEIKRACSKAAAKLGIGLSLLAAVIGVRLVTVTPEGIESGIEELERLDSELASEARADDSATAGRDSNQDKSIVSRLSAGVREHLPGSSGTRDGDRMVSCQLRGAQQFMRADDCAIRGGHSTVVGGESR